MVSSRLRSSSLPSRMYRLTRSAIGSGLPVTNMRTRTASSDNQIARRAAQRQDLLGYGARSQARHQMITLCAAAPPETGKISAVMAQVAAVSIAGRLGGRSGVRELLGASAGWSLTDLPRSSGGACPGILEGQDLRCRLPSAARVPAHRGRKPHSPGVAHSVFRVHLCCWHQACHVRERAGPAADLVAQAEADTRR